MAQCLVGRGYGMGFPRDLSFVWFCSTYSLIIWMMGSRNPESAKVMFVKNIGNSNARHCGHEGTYSVIQSSRKFKEILANYLAL